MPPDIVFLDVASVTGVADGEVGGTPVLSTINLTRPGDHEWEAGGRAALWMAERLAKSLPRAVYIEAPISPGAMRGRTNAKTLLMLNGLAWSFASIAWLRRVPVRSVAVSTVRKWFIGSGRMPSVQAKRACFEYARMLGADPKNLDEADAAAGWYWAAALHGRMIAPSKREHEHGRANGV